MSELKIALGHRVLVSDERVVGLYRVLEALSEVLIAVPCHFAQFNRSSADSERFGPHGAYSEAFARKRRAS